MLTDLPLMTGSRQEPARPMALQSGQPSSEKHAFEEIFEFYPAPGDPPAQTAEDGTEASSPGTAATEPAVAQADDESDLTDVPDAANADLHETTSTDPKGYERLPDGATEESRFHALPPEPLGLVTNKTKPMADAVHDARPPKPRVVVFRASETGPSAASVEQGDPFASAAGHRSTAIWQGSLASVARLPDGSAPTFRHSGNSESRQAVPPIATGHSLQSEFVPTADNFTETAGRDKAIPVIKGLDMALTPASRDAGGNGSRGDKAPAATEIISHDAKPTVQKPIPFAANPHSTSLETAKPHFHGEEVAKYETTSENATLAGKQTSKPIQTRGPLETPDFPSADPRYVRVDGIGAQRANINAVNAVNAKEPMVAHEPTIGEAFIRPNLPAPNKTDPFRKGGPTLRLGDTKDVNAVKVIGDPGTAITTRSGYVKSPPPVAAAVNADAASPADSAKAVPWQVVLPLPPGTSFRPLQVGPKHEQAAQGTAGLPPPPKNGVGHSIQPMAKAATRLSEIVAPEQVQPSEMSIQRLQSGHRNMPLVRKPVDESDPLVTKTQGAPDPGKVEQDRQVFRNETAASGSEKALASQSNSTFPKPTGWTGSRDEHQVRLTPQTAKPGASKSQLPANRDTVLGTKDTYSPASALNVGRMDVPETVRVTHGDDIRPPASSVSSMATMKLPNTMPTKVGALTETPLLADADKVVSAGDPDSAFSETRVTGSPTTNHHGTGAPALRPSPTVVFQQIQLALPQAKANGVDIQLNPEELGRVRLQMRPTDSGLSVQVLADRVETLDLLRRHIDILQRDLKDAGFAANDFTFGKQGSNHGNGYGGSQPDPGTDNANGVELAQDEPPGLSQTGLDLRI